MKAFLIDPQSQTVTEVECTIELREIYHLLDCRCFTTAAPSKNGDVLYCDDELLYSAREPFAFFYSYYAWPIKGKALVVGTDDEGKTGSPRTSIEEVCGCIRWLGSIKADPIFDVSW